MSADRRVNGPPGCLIVDDLAGGRLVQTVTLDPSAREPDRVGALYIQRNPDKLRAVTQRPQSRMSLRTGLPRRARR